ncbi:hypothetical protein HMPREF0971_00279 [Segatella oris F0302]|uniref:Uncharacterized protein n=1 Tax=Segatella oris F0302 TaxID=649760 RepID=D1QMZ0_9BACT|nr:hypothetical protein HMPREF0971_00279 [Segatella oris F0302]
MQLLARSCIICIEAPLCQVQTFMAVANGRSPFAAVSFMR